MHSSLVFFWGGLMAGSALVSSQGTSNGVTLGNLKKRNCMTDSGAEFCFMFPPLDACCSLRSEKYFVSGNCAGCTSTDIHYLFGPGATGLCGKARTGANDGQCINAQNAKGHGWCRVCHTKAKRMLEEGVDAEGPNNSEIDQPEPADKNRHCMLPNLLTKEGKRWFKINHDVPQNITDMIYEWYDDEDNDGPPPTEVLGYEIDNPFLESEALGSRNSTIASYSLEKIGD